MSTWPWSRGSHDELLHGPRLREFWSGAADFSRACRRGDVPVSNFEKNHVRWLPAFPVVGNRESVDGRG